MNFSMNGSPKEIVAFLVSLSGRYASVAGQPAPTVVEVAGDGGRDTGAGNLAEQVKGATEPKAEPVAEVKGAGEDQPPTTEPVAERHPDVPLPDVPPTNEKENPADKPKTRKPRAKASGESKLGTGAPSAGASEGASKVEPTAVSGASTAQQPDAAAFGLPGEWSMMSVQARRDWIQTAQHLAPSQRLELLKANPAPVAETKPEPTTQPETKPTTAAPAAVEHCQLPPTWDAWSLPKRIMWATMRSVSETNSLLVQFKLADKIGEVTADNLFQVRRKMEIAMRMEAQA